LAASAGSRNRSTLNSASAYDTPSVERLNGATICTTRSGILPTRSSPSAVVVHAAAAHSAVPSATRATAGSLESHSQHPFLADGAVALKLQCCIRLSYVVVCTECIVAKRCVLEQKLLYRAYRKSYMRNRLMPKWMTLTFV